MAYIQGITDRTLTDVLNGTPKGYFNVSDWARIKNNILHIESVLKRFHPAIAAMLSMPEKSRIDMMTSADIRALAENTEQLRIAARYLDTSGDEIFHNYMDGGKCPDYTDVNRWERMLERIEACYRELHLRLPITGIAVCGTGIMRQSRFRR